MEYQGTESQNPPIMAAIAPEESRAVDDYRVMVEAVIDTGEELLVVSPFAGNAFTANFWNVPTGEVELDELRVVAHFGAEAFCVFRFHGFQNRIGLNELHAQLADFFDFFLVRFVLTGSKRRKGQRSIEKIFFHHECHDQLIRSKPV